MSQRSPLDVPNFRKGDQLTAAQLNAIAEAVRVALRASGPGMIATAGGIAMRAFRQAGPIAPLAARIVSYQLKPFTGTGGIPPAWRYAWQSIVGEFTSDEVDIVDGPLSSTVGADPYALFAVNGLEKWAGAGSALRYGVGVLLTQASGATLSPLPIAVGTEVTLTPLLPGYPGGYRFSLPNGYDVTCPVPPAATAGRSTVKVDDTLGTILKGVLGW